MRHDLFVIDLVLNQLMRPIFAGGEHLDGPLPAELAAIATSGLVVEDGLLLLRSYRRRRLRTSPGKTPCDHERWVNEIGLETTLPPTDPTWRLHLVGNGLQLAQTLLREALTLTTLPVQFTLSLQSAPTTVDPEIDFASGTLHMNVLRSAEDDARPVINDYRQPVLLLTASTTDQNATS